MKLHYQMEDFASIHSNIKAFKLFYSGIKKIDLPNKYSK